MMMTAAEAPGGKYHRWGSDPAVFGAMDPAQLAAVIVTFIEERDGCALVRLPNGSKTSFDYNALEPLPAWGHFVPTDDGVTVWCAERDDWNAHAATWDAAQDALMAHQTESHPS